MSKGDLIKLDETTELVKITKEKYRYVDPTFAKPSVKLSDHNADIKLKVGNEYFKAHKDVLSTASDYFSAMFSHNMKEKGKDYVELKGISLGGFQIMLEYFYHGHITLVMENVQHCLEASRFFHVEWLTKVCCNYLLRHLSVDNCLLILNLADTYSLLELAGDMYRFLGLNAMKLMEDKVPQLPYDVMLQLVADDYYIDLSEETLLSMLVQWANFNFEERESQLVELMSYIKFYLMTPDELENIPEALLKYDDMSAKVKDAVSVWKAPHKWSVRQPGQPGRGGREVIVLVSEWNSDVLEMIDLNNPYMHSEPFGLLEHDSLADFTSFATCGEFLYAVGGYDTRLQPIDSTLVYDPRLRLWLRMEKMQCSRENFPLVCLANKLYAIGGSSVHVSQSESAEEVESSSSVSVCLKSCESYDPSTNKWTTLPDLPHGMFAHAACCHNGSIYITGGVTDNLSDPVPVGYCYSWTPGDTEWTRKSSMMTRRQSHAMFSANNKIYVMGGYTAGDLEDLSLGMTNCMKNEVYDPSADRWEAIADTPNEFGHIHRTVAILDDVVYLLGGSQSSKYLHEFNLSTQELVQGAFCGKDFVKLFKLTMYYPSFMPSDVIKSPSLSAFATPDTDKQTEP